MMSAGHSCPNFHAGSQSKEFPLRNGRAGKSGSQHPPETSKGRVVSLQNSVKEGTLNFLSSIEYSRCELQPRPSRIPVSRARALAAHGLARSVSVAESTSMRVWKFIKPGIKKQLSLSGVSRKETPSLQVSSRALLKKTGRSSFYNVDLDTEGKGTTSQQEIPTTHLVSEPVPLCKKLPLYSEA
ncbi:cytosolic carboxypeptidase-like protein 5 [Megalops cyprinoides]|uniref:cytosolic carboxypeptidase-like protein 5 n=1 Tax=Megalops cyprinoides TaxID=118141 RepID=UPI001864207C|nr:cytosolic carboxypeptidase-like protein 5 [Megalops cyprinoides]